MRKQTTMTAPIGVAGRLVAVGMLATAAGGCAPVFSDLQSARLVKPGQAEITPSVGTVRFSSAEEDDSGRVQDQLGVQAAVGVSEAVELRGAFVHVSVAGEDGPNVEVVGVGPKVRLVKDRLALYVPVGRAFGGGDDGDLGRSWQVHPTVLLTLPAHENVEVNASAKYLIGLNEGAGRNWAFNLGLGLGPDLDRWALRPEVGVLLNPDDDSRFYHFSLGLSFRPN